MKTHKAFSLGIIVGRFQGIHSGHEKMIGAALSVCGEVGVLVGSSQESGTVKNPFTYETRRQMLERIFGDRIKIYPLPDAGLGNCAAWGDYVVSNVVERFGRYPDLSVSGKEERRAGWLEGELGESVAELYVPKSIDMSATRMREFFVNDDEASWREFSNRAIWDMYPELRAAVIASLSNTETDSI